MFKGRKLDHEIEGYSKVIVPSANGYQFIGVFLFDFIQMITNAWNPVPVCRGMRCMGSGGESPNQVLSIYRA